MSIINTLKDQIGSEFVSTSHDDCVLYAQDVYTKSTPALAVIRPQSVDMLAIALECATSADVCLVPRGGGMSYSSGYVSGNEKTILVDMSDFDNFIDVGHINKSIERIMDVIYMLLEIKPL